MKNAALCEESRILFFIPAERSEDPFRSKFRNYIR